MVLGAGAHVVRIYFCERKNIIQWRKTAISEKREGYLQYTGAGMETERVQRA